MRCLGAAASLYCHTHTHRRAGEVEWRERETGEEQAYVDEVVVVGPGTSISHLLVIHSMRASSARSVSSIIDFLFLFKESDISGVLTD